MVKSAGVLHHDAVIM
uniref:Uncharacterized protein n=1 Tax=Rhizophora mucronata TaxID=61149 RepID=A0A2P2QJT8_RHIMU